MQMNTYCVKFYFKNQGPDAAMNKRGQINAATGKSKIRNKKVLIKKRHLEKPTH